MPSSCSPLCQQSMLSMLHGCTVCVAGSGILNLLGRLLAATALSADLDISLLWIHYAITVCEDVMLLFVSPLPFYVGGCALLNLSPPLPQIGFIPSVSYVSLSLIRFTDLHTALPDMVCVHHWRSCEVKWRGMLDRERAACTRQ